MLNELLAPCCAHEPLWGIKRTRKTLTVTVRCDWCANRLVVKMPNPVDDAIDCYRIGVLWAILIGDLEEPELCPERWPSGLRAKRARRAAGITDADAPSPDYDAVRLTPKEIKVNADGTVSVFGNTPNQVGTAT